MDGLAVKRSSRGKGWMKMWVKKVAAWMGIAVSVSVASGAETKIYKFSGAFVTASNTTFTAPLAAEEVLSLEGADRHPFPEFYFSAEGEHGVTNWTAFPGSDQRVGAEFKVGLTREEEGVLYLFPWKFKFRYLVGWDARRDRPRFASEGGESHTEKALRVGEASIHSVTRSPAVTEWIITRVERVETPSVEWSRAIVDQAAPLRGMLEAIRKNDVERFPAYFTSLDGLTAEKGIELLKSNLPPRILDETPDAVRFYYSGGPEKGMAKLVHRASGAVQFLPLVKEADDWKIGM